MGNAQSLIFPDLFPLPALAATGLLFKQENTQAFLRACLGTCSKGFGVNIIRAGK